MALKIYQRPVLAGILSGWYRLTLPITIPDGMARLFLFTWLMLLVFSCNDTTQKFDQQSLDTKRQNIVAFINAAPCNTPKGCRAIGAGSKPCGGPVEYFIYPVSLDTAKLIQMVKVYSQEMASFNLKWKLKSDCSVKAPPDSSRCISGTCYGYWDGVARRQQ